MKTIEFDFFSDHFASEDLCHIIVVTAAVVDREVMYSTMVIYDSTSDIYRSMDDFPILEQCKISELAEEYAQDLAI